jgi:hypothetical protein
VKVCAEIEIKAKASVARSVSCMVQLKMHDQPKFEHTATKLNIARLNKVINNFSYNRLRLISTNSTLFPTM